MLTIFIFALILGVLVFVHELGHFVVARRNGIQAHEFGFGFPPRLVGVVKDDATGKYKVVWGNLEVESPHTVYSLNWIPLGGFVRIKGEDPTGEEAADPDSFATKRAWTRFKVLVAGVVMNFLFAWLLISIVLTVGFPQEVSPEEQGRYHDVSIRILQVAQGSPAQEMGLQPGDVVEKLDGTPVTSLQEVSDYINAHKGKTLTVTIKRGTNESTYTGIPRTTAPAGEGALGISFSQTATVSYPWYQAIWQGLLRTYDFTVQILSAFGTLLTSLFTGEKAKLDVAGPVGIVYLTKQMSELGFVFLLQFAAVLSINLGIVNVLPIPALDGGRIFFILLEKLKGRPVSRHLENKINQVGFVFLLLLMLFVTFHDFLQFHLWQKLMGVL